MKLRSLASALFVLLALTAFSSDNFAQKGKASKRPVKKPTAVTARKEIIQVASLGKQRRIDTLWKVWQTLTDNYFDQTFNGLDWNQVREDYLPLANKAKNDTELHNLLQEMINRLDRSHFAIIPPEAYKAIATARKAARMRVKPTTAGKATGDKDEADDEEDDDWLLEDSLAQYGIGVEIRMINDQFVITKVEDGSAASNAGLKTGFVIDKINGISLADTVDRIETAYANILTIRQHLPAEIVSWFLNGDRDTSVTLSCLDEADRPREFKIPRERLKGQATTVGKNIPEQYLGFDVKSLPGDVGHIKFNVFALPIIEKFCSAMTELKDKKAIIIDLRGNMGGVIGTIIGVSGMLTDRTINIGTSIYRTGSEVLMSKSKAKNFKGKLVFLVDGQTMSAAEIFAAAVQESGRALVVGEKTAGEALPSVSVELPTGAFLMYPIANFKTAKGKMIEGVGVQPDFVAVLDRKQLLAGTDSQLEKALSLIKDDTQVSKPPQIAIIGSSASAPNYDPDSDLPPPPKAAPKPAQTPPKIAGDGPGLSTLSTGTPPLQKGQIASVTVKALPSSTPEPPHVKEEKALRAIADFITAVGGEDALKKVNSFSLSGISQMGVKGSTHEFGFREYRQLPDKLAILLSSSATGEIREIYDGSRSIVQSDLGMDREARLQFDSANIDVFSPITTLRNPASFTSLKYQGTFDQNGRKFHLVEAKMAGFYTVLLSFDVETKMLVSFTSEFSTVTLGDYRKVGDIMLPFKIDNGTAFGVTLSEIKLNPVIDESYFKRKEYCFDKVL